MTKNNVINWAWETVAIREALSNYEIKWVQMMPGLHLFAIIQYNHLRFVPILADNTHLARIR
jgi:hypothetical protein